MSESRINASNIEIELEGKKLVLVPSLKAIIGLSRQYNGLFNASERLVKADIDVATIVISLGANLGPKEVEGIPEAIYRTGLRGGLLSSLIDFVGILANGGKPINDETPRIGDDDAGNQ